MSELLKSRESKKERLKELLMKLHHGADIDELREEFREVLMNISPLEIPVMEQELVKEGISPKEITKMCDVHVEIFRGSVSDGGEFIAELPSGHPFRTLYDENRQIMKNAEVLALHATTIISTDNEKMREESLEFLKEFVNQLRAIGFTHYNREEMIIFPHLEKRGITAVTKVLWNKHDEIRLNIKMLDRLLRQTKEMDPEAFATRLKEITDKLSSLLIDMVFRENNIFYPTLMTLLSEGEWVAIKEQEDDIGYYEVSPGSEWKPEAPPLPAHEVEPDMPAEDLINLPKEVQAVLRGKVLEGDRHKVRREGDIELDTGYLLPGEIDAILRALPLDITFIDKDDRVRFFSGGERAFVRTPSIIGRPVQLCHPPKSVAIVDRILKMFKEGKRDKAEFWIPMGDRLIYIRYFPLRNDKGEYLGTLEVTQDVTEIRNLKGQKRLLDWK